MNKYLQILKNWHNIVKETGPELFHNNTRDWKTHIENQNYSNAAKGVFPVNWIMGCT